MKIKYILKTIGLVSALSFTSISLISCDGDSTDSSSPTNFGSIDGVYSSEILLPDGFTHIENILVTEDTATALNSFSNDQGHAGEFSWSGVLTPVSSEDGSPKYLITGSGTIKNRGTRSFELINSELIYDFNESTYRINWQAIDPGHQFLPEKPIGGSSVLQNN